MRIVLFLLACGVLFGSSSSGTPASYVVGNIGKLSPGDEGKLVLLEEKAVFRSGKNEIAVPYDDIQNAELGTKLKPAPDASLLKVWQLHKRFTDRTMHQMLIVEFGDGQTMTLELEESAAAETLEAIQIKTGKLRRATNAEPWWGDSLWKTNKNNNTVSPEALGNPAQ